MKAKIPLVLSFAAGMALAAIVVFLSMMRYSQQQSQGTWVWFAREHVRYALKLSRGEHELLLQDLEKRLPSIVTSVHSFGDNDQTRLALHEVKEFYEETGKPVPPEIAGLLASRRR